MTMRIPIPPPHLLHEGSPLPWVVQAVVELEAKEGDRARIVRLRRILDVRAAAADEVRLTVQANLPDRKRGTTSDGRLVVELTRHDVLWSGVVLRRGTQVGHFVLADDNAHEWQHQPEVLDTVARASRA